MLEAIGIRKRFQSLEVLKGIDLHIQKSEVISIVGASGSGKTTLLQVLSTLEKPDQGEILLDGVSLNLLSASRLAQIRNQKIGFVFQFHNLLEEFTGLENACIPALIAGKSLKEASREIMPTLEFLGLKDRIHHKPSELSGGEQQRFAVARALINKPALVFADEPSGNLDSHNANELHHLFFRLRDEFGQTFVLVTHNEAFAAMADRTLVLQDGRILSE